MTNTDHEALMDHGDPALARAKAPYWKAGSSTSHVSGSTREYAERARIHTTTFAPSVKGVDVKDVIGRVHYLAAVRVVVRSVNCPATRRLDRPRVRR